MRLPYGEFRPDIADLDAGVAAVARNVYPGANSYQPFKGFSAVSSALASDCRGLVATQQKAGNWQVLAGTATKLYQYDATTQGWTDRSLGGGSYSSVPADEHWSMAQYGTYCLAAQANDDLQQFDIETPGAFAAVAGSPPRARFVDVVDDYVFLGALTSDPYAVKWSGTGSHTTWTGGNSGGQTFYDGGRVMGVAGAAKLIIQERGFRRIYPQPGQSVVFAFEKILAKGTIAPRSVIPWGGTIAYLAEDGFWFNSEPIGRDKIDRYFIGLANPNRLFSVLGAADPVRPIFYWFFKTNDNATTYDYCLLYNWKTGRWAEVANLEVSMVMSIAAPGLSLEALDALYPSLDNMTISLDSRVWSGGRPVFGAIGTDRKLSYLEGANLEATLETGDTQLIPGRRAMVRGARPLVDTDDAVLRVGTRDRMADALTWRNEAAMQASGRCPTPAGGRHHRFRTRVPAGATWTHALGVDVDIGDVSPLGVR